MSGSAAYAGYRGGWIDIVALRVSEIFMSFPQIILVLLLVSIVGQSLFNLIVIFVATGWGSMYRMARARMLSLREEEYVQALQSFGVGRARICYKHMLPNALGPIMVNITLTTAMFILAEAGLSFLGLGVPLSIPTWGNILNVAQDLRMLQNNWWMWLPVGSVISLFRAQRQLHRRRLARLHRSDDAGLSGMEGDIAAQREGSEDLRRRVRLRQEVTASSIMQLLAAAFPHRRGQRHLLFRRGRDPHRPA